MGVLRLLYDKIGNEIPQYSDMMGPVMSHSRGPTGLLMLMLRLLGV